MKAVLMFSLCVFRVSAEGEIGKRGEATDDGEENAGLEARGSNAAADVGARLGLGPRGGGACAGDCQDSGAWGKVFALHCIALHWLYIDSLDS